MCKHFERFLYFDTKHSVGIDNYYDDDIESDPLDYNEFDLRILISSEDSEIKIPISFCPICGENLNDMWNNKYGT